MTWLKAHWAAIGGIIAAILPFELPSINTYITAHPHAVVSVLLGAVVSAWYANQNKSGGTQ